MRFPVRKGDLPAITLASAYQGVIYESSPAMKREDGAIWVAFHQGNVMGSIIYGHGEWWSVVTLCGVPVHGSSHGTYTNALVALQGALGRAGALPSHAPLLH